MAVSAYAEPMSETYPRPRFGEPREPKNRVNPGSRLMRVVDFVTVSHTRSIAFLLLCGLLLFLPGFFNIPPVDRDEARFAQATKQMVESGDFVDIRFQDDVRYKKPVGIYWLQSAAIETASALGLPRSLVIKRIAYRAARSGLITGVLLATARVAGETAPLLFTALSNQFFSLDLTKTMANLPVTINNFVQSPYAYWKELAWSGALLITLTVLALNIGARVLGAERAAK